MTPWKCGCCGEIHDNLPYSFGFDAPIHWGDRDSTSPPDGCAITPDYCIIDEGNFFIRGVLEIPIHGTEDQFVIGIWSTLSEANFEREQELNDKPERVKEPPYFGWFANRLWQYPDTLNLKCNVVTRAPGERPAILLEPSDHPLSVEQREGISLNRFQELSAQFLHGWKHPEFDTIADN
jgi:hypothetical protein